jgi:hypothetical protein
MGCRSGVGRPAGRIKIVSQEMLMVEATVPAPQRPAPTGTTPVSPRVFDVYLSYNKANYNWVSTELLPRLLRADLEVAAGDESFVPGVPVLENIGSAIRRSRYTVAVITQAWLGSHWAKYEWQTIIHEDVTNGTRRLIPLLVEPCSLPTDLGMLTPGADFTDPGRWRDEWDRLLGQLTRRDPPEDPVPGLASTAKKAFRTLAGLLREHDVHDLVVGYCGDFKKVDRQIRILSAHKSLHDLLHEIQVRCYRPITVAAVTFPSSESLDDLAEYQAGLKVLSDRVQVLTANREIFKNPHVLWVQKLVQAYVELDSAIQYSDARHLDEGIKLLKAVIGQEPPKVNARLSTLAGDLCLPDLVQSMEAIRTRLEAHLDAERAAEFRQGAEGLAELHQLLQAAVEQHDTWQRVDDLLRATESQVRGEEGDLGEIGKSWPGLKELTQPLFGAGADPHVLQFQKEGEKLETALTEQNPNPRRARQAFRSYRGQATQLFYEVDKTLYAHCDELRKVGRGLALVLEVLSHE